ncbi:phage protein NinX family protein [Providencia rettgeri]
MNKYTGLSDFEINKRVFVAAKIEHEDTDLHSNKVFYGDGANWIEFNPCNNPADAMPIIIENNISLRAPTITDRWKAEFIDEYGNYVGYRRALNKNPLRAAMELFLLMKDAENEG